MVDEEGSIKFEELSTEQQERAKACKTPDELLALAQQEGMELTDDDLAMVSGGWGIERDDMQGDDGCGRRFSQM